MTLAATLLAAPLLYAWIGLGCLALAGAARERAPLAPLLGFAVVGWLPSVALALGGAPGLVPIGLLGLGLLGLRASWIEREAWSSAGAAFALAYLWAILLLALAPFPGFGVWGTDWAMYLRAGPAMLAWAGDSAAFGDGLPELMRERPRLFAARPHGFSAAAAPAALVLPSLVGLEIGAAVAAASTASTFAYVTRAFGGRAPSLAGFVLLLSSPLWAQHLLVLWPKLAAAGCVLASVAEAVRYRSDTRPRDVAWCGVWLGSAVAFHHSSLLYLPLVAWLVAAPQRTGARGGVGSARLAAAAVLVAGIVVIAGPYEVWALARLGPAARLESNPAVHFAASLEPGYVVARTLRQLVATSVGTGWLRVFESAAAASTATDTAGAAVAAARAVSTWLVLLAGTFAGVLLPVGVAVVTQPVARSTAAQAWRRMRASPLLVPVSLGAAVAVVGAAVLAPFVDVSGAQLGATPVCIALLFAASSSLPAASLRRAAIVTLSIATLPMLVQLALGSRVWARARAGDTVALEWLLAHERDARLMGSLDAVSLGEVIAPLLVVAVVVALAAVGWRWSRAAPAGG